MCVVNVSDALEHKRQEPGRKAVSPAQALQEACSYLAAIWSPCEDRGHVGLGGGQWEAGQPGLRSLRRAGMF